MAKKLTIWLTINAKISCQWSTALTCILSFGKESNRQNIRSCTFDVLHYPFNNAFLKWRMMKVMPRFQEPVGGIPCFTISANRMPPMDLDQARDKPLRNKHVSFLGCAY